MILKILCPIMIILFFELSWIISASNGKGKESTIMKTLQRLVLSRGKICPKKLIKLCKRESNFTEVLHEAVTLGIEHCHEQFKYTRWNCTMDEKLFEDVSRETSVVTAIFSASLSHTFARSCVGRKFIKCNQMRDENFYWNRNMSRIKAPSDDIKFGRRMAKRILIGLNGRRKKRINKRINKKNFIDAVFIHNVEVGLRTSGKMEEICNCQDYSSKCGVKICRKILPHFKEVAQVLRNGYTEARMIREDERTMPGFSFRRKEKNRFYYVKQSPNFCKDTHGRECRDEMNCSILCCARGFNIKNIKTPRKCRCVMSVGKCCNVKCQTCPAVEKKFICK